MKRQSSKAPAWAESNYLPADSRQLSSLRALLNPRKNRVLQVAQAALPESQFKAFRQVFLDEFGQNGLESELIRLLGEQARHSQERNGQEQTTQERRCRNA